MKYYEIRRIGPNSHYEIFEMSQETETIVKYLYIGFAITEKGAMEFINERKKGIPVCPSKILPSESQKMGHYREDEE